MAEAGSFGARVQLATAAVSLHHTVPAELAIVTTRNPCQEKPSLPADYVVPKVLGFRAASDLGCDSQFREC